jgi:hypothetical protein
MSAIIAAMPWEIIVPAVLDLVIGALPNKFVPWKGVIYSILSSVGKASEKIKES